VSDFDIFLDTDNELAFTVAIEGANEAAVRSQFILEGPRGISLCFEGRASGAEITVGVPTLKGIIREGLYNTRLEVIVDDRVFTPLQMQANVKPAIKVEAVVRTAAKVGGPVVTAAVVNRTKPLVETAVEKPAAPPPAPIPRAATVPVTQVKPPVAPVRPVAKDPPMRPTSELDSLLDSLESE
jgi:hypothetical protein